ncbi:MAG TPA: hypothetical protein VL307_18890 [Chitinophagaceae bacterium]|nr:hypothetical protein [Chitinophagaceae bacterium]
MRLITAALVVFFVTSLHAQRFGGNPPSVQWRQINNPATRVIFPKGLDSSAARIAGIADYISKTTFSTIGARQTKVDVVLHPNTIVSNGYVALGPFRSEFYLTPEQNSFALGSLRWQDMLAMHEYRHVQQYNNFNVGLSHAFRIVFGQQGQELANALAIPNWFWEGDAVYQETLLSGQGRGRLPFFFNDYRALWLAGKNYSYMKLRNGSLRDFTPDHYRLGYMLVAYGRQKYGDEFWKKVTGDAAAFKGLFYPFQRAVKQYTQQSFTAFTEEAMQYFKEQSPAANPAAAQPKHFMADQEFPAYAGTDSVLYMKTSYKQLPAFVLSTHGTERRIRVRDVSIDNQFAYANGKIVYASYRPAARWSWNDYNELQVLDIASGRQTSITRKTKYFSPSLSADAASIVAVAMPAGGQSSLHLLQTASGALIKALPNKDSLYYTYPVFTADEKQVISTVRLPNGSMSLALINTQDGNVDYLTAPVLRVLGHPTVQHDTVYFTAADNGFDRLFAFTLKDRQLYRLLLPANGIGAYQPTVSAGKITFTSFTAAGYRLQEAPLAGLGWTQVSNTEWTAPISQFSIDLQKNSAAGALAKIPVTPLSAVQKYRQSTGLLNFHSLLPYVTDPDYRLSLVGNNILNTMQSELFAAYNRNEQYKQAGANLTYGGFFPHINVGASYIFDRRDFTNSGTAVYWNEGQVNAGLSVPLNLSKGRSLASLTIGSDYVLKNVSFRGWYKDTLNKRGLNDQYRVGYINSYVSFTHQLQQARQHIYPRLAQSVYINYRNAVQEVQGHQLLLSGNFYFPAFALTHNIVISLAYQNRDTLGTSFSNSFPFSRGYEVPNLRNMYKWGVNYHLPLLYPDWGFGNIVYFQRVRLNAFYDYTRAGEVAFRNGRRSIELFRSTGAEIFFDTKWWNELPLNVGFRYSHLLDPDLYAGANAGSERFEFVLPVNLFQR